MSVTRLCFHLQPGVNIIDLAKSMSSHHRTLIRQKQIFTVVGGMVTGSGDNNVIDVSTAPNTWYMRSAVNRIFKAWKNYRHRVFQALPEPSDGLMDAKYADFKLLLNNENSTLVQDAKNLNGDSLSCTEWDYSKLYDETGSYRTFHIVGEHGATKYSALQGWLATTPQILDADPLTASIDGVAGADYLIDFINNLHETDDAIDSKLEEMADDNDQAPFDRNTLYGSDFSAQNNLQPQASLIVSDNFPVQPIAGFQALCGLIQIDVTGSASDCKFYIDVVNKPEAF